MGHRAYVAYEINENMYSVHYSHWGAHDLELVPKITKDTPLGGENDMEPDFIGALGKMLDDEFDEVSGKLTEAQDPTPVEPDPTAVVHSMGEIMEMIEESIGIEALYVVTETDDAFDVEGYHVASDLEGRPLLFKPRWWGQEQGQHNLSHDRGWLSGLGDGLSDLAEGDRLADDEANEMFMRKVLETFEDSLNKHVLAHSPAITDDMIQAHPEAFIEMGGRSRVLGEMYPSRLKAKQHQIPEDFPDVKTADGERVSLTGTTRTGSDPV